MSRHSLELVKNRRQLVSMVLMKLCVGLTVGIIWSGSAVAVSNKTIYLTESAMFCCVFSSTMDTLMATLLHAPGIKVLLHREYINGLYSFSAWYTATMSMFFLQQWVASMLLALPVYFMAGLRPGADHFAVFVL